MAKTQEGGNNSKVKRFLLGLGIPTGIVAVAMAIFIALPQDLQDQISLWIEVQDSTEIVIPPDPHDERTVTSLVNFYPSSTTQHIITHDFIKLSYAESHEQAEWVAYELRAEDLQTFAFERPSSFKVDPKVTSGSAHPSDYLKSGYDRGHLAPAADMSFDEDALKQSFYMSNISPQQPGFNRGIWKELEMQVRDWCKQSQNLYVVTGPVLTLRAQRRLGKEKALAAPSRYYKILLDLNDVSSKAAAFLLPNKKSDERLSDYMVTIDSLEALTQIDFFPHLPDKQEKELESRTFKNKWDFDEERFMMRKLMWNPDAAQSRSFE
ncbi:MAG: DNA/RNA non-specific endonuclease [Bacteroidota bacterium]